jgi:hypothetical protein
LFDEWGRAAERHRLEAQGRVDEGQSCAERAQRAEAEAGEVRAVRRTQLDGLGRAIDLIERGGAIAIGRESA